MGPPRPGPNVGTDGLGQYKSPGMPDSIRANLALVASRLNDYDFDLPHWYQNAYAFLKALFVVLQCSLLMLLCEN